MKIKLKYDTKEGKYKIIDKALAAGDGGGGVGLDPVHGEATIASTMSRLDAVDTAWGGVNALVFAEIASGIMAPKPGDTDQDPDKAKRRAGLVKGAVGAALLFFNLPWLNKDASTFAGRFLLFDAARDVLPLDETIRDFVNSITGKKDKSDDTAAGADPVRPDITPRTRVIDRGGNVIEMRAYREASALGQSATATPTLNRLAATNV